MKSAPRRRPPAKQDVAQLFAEMMGLVETGSALMTARAARPRAVQTTRLPLFKKALAAKKPSTALAKIRNLVPDDGKGAQGVFVHAHACILETNSGGLSILLDRFDRAELTRIAAALKSIGAATTLADLKALRAKRATAATVDRRHEIHVREMERKLLAFCKKHIAELAAA